MLKIIQDFCKNENLLFGITDNTPLKPKTNLIDVPFVNSTFERRIDPLIHMNNCKSIITIIRSYKINTFTDTNKPLIASPNQNYDYHTEFFNTLEQLVSLLNIDNSIEYKIFCDNGELIERDLAVKSGLGYFSKNANVINEQFGSCFNIGYIMINKEIPFEPKIIEKDCGDCIICKNACPTGAINGDYTISHKKCLSAINQLKDEPTDEQKSQMGNIIYGCNICAKVCPHNKNNLYYEVEDYEFSDFLNNTNREFKEKFTNKGFVWRGNSILKRNALIALDNSKKAR